MMRAAVLSAVLGCLVVQADPAIAQDPAAVSRIKERLDRPPAPLTPSGPLQLRPTFKSGVEKHPFVPTLDEHLKKTFELTDFQRQYAAYTARCCGLDLGALFKRVDTALDERRTRKIREEIARELRTLEAARATIR